MYAKKFESRMKNIKKSLVTKILYKLQWKYESDSRHTSMTRNNAFRYWNCNVKRTR